MQKTVLQDLEEIKKENDSSLSKSDFEKIKYYYGNAVASILGEAYCMLRGSSMNKKERTALTYLGALTGLFDDFFDEKNTPLEHIHNLIDNPNDVQYSNTHEKLFTLFWQKVIENSEHIDIIKKHFYQVFDAQVLSQKQTSSNLSFDEIKDITCQKGAASIIFYRTAFGDINDNAEHKMLTALGSIGQLENDIFDIYKDHENGIFTLATTTKKIENLRKIYSTLSRQIIENAHQTPYQAKNVTAFLRFTSAIISRGFVCLDFLEKNEKSTDGIFKLDEYERKQLVCDMEKPKNILGALRYYAKLKTD